MSKDKAVLSSLCDKVIEYSFYLFVVAVTFSTSLTDAAIIAMIAAWVARNIFGRRVKYGRSPVFILLAVFLLWNVLSFVNTQYLYDSLRGLRKMLKYAMIFAVTVDVMGDADMLKKTVYAMLGWSYVVGLNGIVQAIIGFDLLRFKHVNEADYLRRICSSFATPNSFSVYLVVLCVIACALLFYRKRHIKEVILLAILLSVLLYCLLMTYSRGAWLSFMICLILLGMMKSKRLAIFLAAFIISMPFLLPHNARQRLIELKNMKHGTTRERLILWRSAVDMAKTHPVLGSGVNTYTQNFPRFRPERFRDNLYTHNSYLQMATEIGFAGAAIFLCFAGTVYGLAWKKLRAYADMDRKSLFTGLYLGGLGFMLYSITESAMFVTVLASFFWFILGTVAAFSRTPISES